MKSALHLHTGQHMTMTPQLLQSIRLLQLSSLELEQELRQALEKNVMLEAEEEETADDPEAERVIAEETQLPAPDSTLAAVTGCDAAADQKVEIDYDYGDAESCLASSSAGNGADDQESFESRHAAPNAQDVRVRALAQLQLLVRTPREAAMVGAILDAIDDNGYLERSLDDLRDQLSQTLEVSADEMEAALAKVQSVEPSGFGARDLRECLHLQLRMLAPDTPGRELAKFIVASCLERLAGGDLAQVRDTLQVSKSEMTVAVDLILSLNPKPSAASAHVAQAVVPDVIVGASAGGWRVELSTGALPRVRVNSLYERLLNGGKPHGALREQLQEARWLVRGIEMRHDTLLRTARVIFERQQAFLRRGEEGMAPLTLREVAEAIGMHESTVCRVTSNKYVQTPWGVYELKAFFPSHLNGAEGETSGTAVRAMIRRIIDTESRKSPLCDGAIAAILHRGGVSVARRTIAKYREAMKIAPAKERRAMSVRAAMRIAG